MDNGYVIYTDDGQYAYVAQANRRDLTLPQPDWVSGNTYIYGDIVANNSSVYMCIKDVDEEGFVSTDAPSSTPAEWKELPAGIMQAGTVTKYDAATWTPVYNDDETLLMQWGDASSDIFSIENGSRAELDASLFANPTAMLLNGDYLYVVDEFAGNQPRYGVENGTHYLPIFGLIDNGNGTANITLAPNYNYAVDQPVYDEDGDEIPLPNWEPYGLVPGQWVAINPIGINTTIDYDSPWASTFEVANVVDNVIVINLPAGPPLDEVIIDWPDIEDNYLQDNPYLNFEYVGVEVCAPRTNRVAIIDTTDPSIEPVIIHGYGSLLTYAGDVPTTNTLNEYLPNLRKGAPGYDPDDNPEPGQLDSWDGVPPFDVPLGFWTPNNIRNYGVPSQLEWYTDLRDVLPVDIDNNNLQGNYRRIPGYDLAIIDDTLFITNRRLDFIYAWDVTDPTTPVPKAIFGPGVSDGTLANAEDFAPPPQIVLYSSVGDTPTAVFESYFEFCEPYDYERNSLQIRKIPPPGLSRRTPILDGDETAWLADYKGQWSCPWSITTATIDGTSYLYVSDYGTSRVEKWELTGGLPIYSGNDVTLSAITDYGIYDMETHALSVDDNNFGVRRLPQLVSTRIITTDNDTWLYGLNLTNRNYAWDDNYFRGNVVRYWVDPVTGDISDTTETTSVYSMNGIVRGDGGTADPVVVNKQHGIRGGGGAGADEVSGSPAGAGGDGIVVITWQTDDELRGVASNLDADDTAIMVPFSESDEPLNEIDLSPDSRGQNYNWGVLEMWVENNLPRKVNFQHCTFDNVFNWFADYLVDSADNKDIDEVSYRKITAKGTQCNNPVKITNESHSSQTKHTKKAWIEWCIAQMDKQAKCGNPKSIIGVRKHEERTNSEWYFVWIRL